MDSEPLLRMEHITKTFSGVRVLDDVCFEVPIARHSVLHWGLLPQPGAKL